MHSLDNPDHISYVKAAPRKQFAGWSRRQPPSVAYSTVLSRAEKELAAILVDFAKGLTNKDAVGYAFPSDSALADMLNTSPRQVQRYLNRLEQYEYIRRETYYPNGKAGIGAKGGQVRKIFIAPTLCEEAGIDWKTAKGYRFIDIKHLKKEDRARTLRRKLAKNKRLIRADRRKSKSYRQEQKRRSKFSDSRTSVVLPGAADKNVQISSFSQREIKGTSSTSLRSFESYQAKADAFSFDPEVSGAEKSESPENPVGPVERPRDWFRNNEFPGNWVAVTFLPEKGPEFYSLIPGQAQTLGTFVPEHVKRDVRQGLNTTEVVVFPTQEMAECFLNDVVSSFTAKEVAIVADSREMEIRPDFGKFLYEHMTVSTLSRPVGYSAVTALGRSWCRFIYPRLAISSIGATFNEVPEALEPPNRPPCQAWQLIQEDPRAFEALLAIYGDYVYTSEAGSRFLRMFLKVVTENPQILRDRDLRDTFIKHGMPSDLRHRWNARTKLKRQWKEFTKTVTYESEMLYRKLTPTHRSHFDN